MAFRLVFMLLFAVFVSFQAVIVLARPVCDATAGEDARSMLERIRDGNGRNVLSITFMEEWRPMFANQLVSAGNLRKVSDQESEGHEDWQSTLKCIAIGCKSDTCGTCAAPSQSPRAPQANRILMDSSVSEEFSEPQGSIAAAPGPRDPPPVSTPEPGIG